MLQYFGEKVEKPFCGNCSGCMAREERDVSRQAGQIVAAVIAMNGRYGKATVARVLCGRRTRGCASAGWISSPPLAA
ncbi:MAG: RQC domain-containing protein [Christensenellales bacterium]